MKILTLGLGRLGPLFAVMVGALSVGSARADLMYVTRINGNEGLVSEFTTTGEEVKPALVSGLTDPTGIALAGGDLFVADRFSRIGEYTTAGAVVNPALISGLSGPGGILVSGGNLFVTNATAGTIGEYTITGAVVNPALISGLNGPVDIALSGGDLFVANQFNHTIGEYTTAGAVVNPALISVFSFPTGIAVSGGDLFVANGDDISEYTTAGAVVNPALVSGLDDPIGIAVSGSDLFVANARGPGIYGTGFIGEYDATTGAPVNAVLIGDLNAPGYIVIAPAAATPEPGSLLLLGTGLMVLAFRRRRHGARACD